MRSIRRKINKIGQIIKYIYNKGDGILLYKRRMYKPSAGLYLSRQNKSVNYRLRRTPQISHKSIKEGIKEELKQELKKDIKNSIKRRVKKGILYTLMYGALFSAETVILKKCHENQDKQNLEINDFIQKNYGSYPIATEFVNKMAKEGIFDYQHDIRTKKIEKSENDLELDKNLIPQLMGMKEIDFEVLLLKKDIAYYQENKEVITMVNRKRILDLMSNEGYKKALINQYTDLSFNRLFSLSIALLRGTVTKDSLENQSAEKVEKVVERYIQQMKAFEEKTIVDKESKIIAFSYYQRKKQTEDFVNVVRKLGVKQENIVHESGVNDVYANQDAGGERFLDAIKHTKGKVCILINTHGDKSGSVAVGTNISEEEELYDSGFDYRNLGTAMIRSGNSMNNFTIIVDVCYAYDFGRSLYTYLQQHEVKEFPTIIVSGNKGKTTMNIDGNGIFSFSGDKVEPSIKGRDFLKKEDDKQSKFYLIQDPAFFVPMPKDHPQEVKKKNYLEIS